MTEPNRDTTNGPDLPGTPVPTNANSPRETANQRPSETVNPPLPANTAVHATTPQPPQSPQLPQPPQISPPLPQPPQIPPSPAAQLLSRPAVPSPSPLPGTWRPNPALRALPIAELQPLQVGALWRGKPTPLLSALLEALRARARLLAAAP